MPTKQALAVKAGAKRTVLGGVVANGQREDSMDDGKKPRTPAPHPTVAHQA